MPAHRRDLDGRATHMTALERDPDGLPVDLHDWREVVAIWFAEADVHIDGQPSRRRCLDEVLDPLAGPDDDVEPAYVRTWLVTVREGTGGVGLPTLLVVTRSSWRYQSSGTAVSVW